MIYELRIYHAMPGRLAALTKRFDATTLRIWEKHGIRQVGFWTVLIGERSNDLFYMLEWENMAERQEKWDAFQSDPEWIRLRAESERDGPLYADITSTLLSPTGYSKLR